MSHQPKINRAIGFTLLEILIALFIFTIVSMLLVGALHTVMNAQSGTEHNASRLRQAQVALLLMSRDVEQAVNRPIMLANGREDRAFIGTSTSFTFTHLGFANPTGALVRSGLQRTRYSLNKETLSRDTWQVLDQAPTTKTESRQLLREVTEIRFEYLDKNGRFHADWPLQAEVKQILPRALRVSLTFANWGTISQLYVIAAENQGSQLPAMPTATESSEF